MPTSTSVAEKTVTCFQSKEELLDNPLYKLAVALNERLDMMTVADVRPMALLYDWLLEEEMAGNPGLDPHYMRMACWAALCLVPPRTAAVVTAIEESGFEEFSDDVLILVTLLSTLSHFT